MKRIEFAEGVSLTEEQTIAVARLLAEKDIVGAIQYICKGSCTDIVQATKAIEALEQELAARAERKKEQPFVQEMEHRLTSFGSVTYIKVRTPNYRRLHWSEVWEAFSQAYPGKWAIEFFPPKEKLLNEANVYHLFVLDGEPNGFDVSRSAR